MAASYGPRVWLALATIYVVWGSTFMAVTIAVTALIHTYKIIFPGAARASQATN